MALGQAALISLGGSVLVTVLVFALLVVYEQTRER